MRSLVHTAVFLSLVLSTIARIAVPHSYREYQALEARKPEKKVQTKGNRLIRWFKHFFSRQVLEEPPIACYEDGFFEFVGSLGDQFCQDYMNFPNRTFTIDYTPTRYVLMSLTTNPA